MKKKKLIFLIITAVILMITLVFSLTACGGDEQTDNGSGGGGNECSFHWDDDGDGQCDTCDFLFATSAPVGSSVSAQDLITKFNEFFSSSIDLSSFMDGRYIVNDFRVKHRAGNNEKQIDDPRVDQIFLSNNIAHVVYKDYLGVNRVTDEYFVLNTNGYYVIQNGVNEEYIFEPIYVPELSSITLTSNFVSYNADEDLFYISNDWTRSFLTTLLVKTNFAQNFESLDLSAKEFTNLISNLTCDLRVRLDADTKEITYLYFVANLNRNGAPTEVLNLKYEKTNDGLTIYFHNLFEVNEEINIRVMKADNGYYAITYNKKGYNRAGSVDGDLEISFVVYESVDETIILQAGIDDSMKTCDRLLTNYNVISSPSYNEYTLEGGRETCPIVYVRDTANRCYLRFVYQENELGKMVYLFDGLQIRVDESDVCMAEIPKNRTDMELVSHGANEAWKDEIVAKYARLFYAENICADGCNHIVVHDDEYDVDLLFFRVGNSYQLIDFDMEYPSLFVCYGIIDLKNRTISVTDHAYNETLLASLQETEFSVISSYDTECYSVAIYDAGMESYMIFLVQEGKARFTHFQPIADGMCTGTLYLATESLRVNYHYNH